MVFLEQHKLILSLDDNADGNNISENSEFNYVWLRDNCPCEECLHPSTQERLLITAEIPDDIAPIEAIIETDILNIKWNDKSHLSKYPLKWLHQHSYTEEKDSISGFNDPASGGDLKLWGNEIESDIPTFQYTEIIQDDGALLSWCEAIRDVGLTIVRGAPTVEGEIERFAEHVAHVREVIYDRLHNVRATPGEYNAYNVASTSLELKPHTDMPNYNNPPGVQMFHFLKNEADGGVSTAVDGFNVARQLKEIDPQAYQILSEVAMPFKIDSSKGDIRAANPMLTLDSKGNLKVFRYSNQTASTLNIPQEQMQNFYSAYRLLGRLVEDPANMVKFRLNTGDIMATNNLRVMHGRTAYDPTSGERHLQLSYMDYDDVMSRIRMIKKAQQVA